MNILFKNVDYVYLSNTDMTEAVQGINLEISGNKIISVIGHTGSGKSTLSKLMKGLISPQSGSIIINGEKRQYIKNKLSIAKDIGLVFQYPEHQIFETTVYKDISYGPRKLGWNEQQILEKTEYILNLLGLKSDYLHRSTLALSGGEKRRVAIAGVLIMEPNILILDEPTAGLDPRGKSIILKSILEWQQKERRTVIFITHNMDDVLEYSDEVIVMHKGRLKYHSTPSFLFTNYADELNELDLDIPECIKLLKLFNKYTDTPINIDKRICEQTIFEAIEQRIIK